jgi:hypothetical protein
VLDPPPGWAQSLVGLAQGKGWSAQRVEAQSDPALWSPPSREASSLLVVEDLHLVLPLAEQRDQVREALGQLARGGCRIVLSSDVHPLDYLRTSTWEEGAAAQAGSENGDDAESEKRRSLDLERLRWGTLLASVRPVRIAWKPGDPPESKAPRLVEVLCEECDWTPWLEPVRQEIGGDPRFAQGEIDERQVVHWVAERAEPLFRRIWAMLPSEDRLAVIQLAEGDLLNPRNETSVARLMRRGLVRREKSFRLVSRSFALFALRVERPERVREWERGATGGSWEMMRLPLALVFLLVLGYAVYAGRDAVDVTLTLIPALAAGFPTVVRLLSTLRIASSSTGGGAGTA